MLVESDEEDDRSGSNHVVDADIASSSRSIPVEIFENNNYSSGPDVYTDVIESMLSHASDKNHDTNIFIGMNEIKEPNIQNAEDNFTRGISDNISQETSNGFSYQTENFDQPQLDVDAAVENSFSCISQEMETEQNYLTEETSPICNDDNRNANPLNEEWVDFVPTAADFDATIFDASRRSENCETSLIEVEGSEAQTASPIEGHTSNAKETLQIEFNAQPSIVLGETSDVEDGIAGNESLIEYNQADRIDMLEETIEEAKTNKVLFVLSPTFFCTWML